MEGSRLKAALNYKMVPRLRRSELRDSPFGFCGCAGALMIFQNPEILRSRWESQDRFADNSRFHLVA